MRNFIKKTILFFILFVISNIAYLVILQKTDWDYIKRIEAMYLDNPKNDVIVIGNSLALDGIDTEYLSDSGVSAYNLALTGSSLNTNYLQLEEYLNKYEYKPKFVVLGYGTFIGSFKKGRVQPIVDYTQKKTWQKLLTIPMLEFRWKFEELLKKLISKPHREAHLSKGQLKFNKRIPDNTQININNEFEIYKYENSEPIYDIIDLCNQHNIKLFIVEMPGFKNTRHEKKFDCMKLDKVNNNGILLDYNNFENSKSIDDQKDWIGNSHLNLYGAKKVTIKLLADIKMYEANWEQISECQ